MTKSQLKPKPAILKSGFTLFEMLISVAIIVIITGVVFFNHSKFKTDTEITNLAYRLALSFREAQVYSISVKQFSTNQTGANFNVPYGIHFNQRTPDAFILFADANNDGLYTPPPGENDMFCAASGSECVEKVTIGRNNRIKGWCGILWSSSNSQPCFRWDEPDDHFLDIKFKRPNPDALFDAYESTYESGSVINPPPCSDFNGRTACTGWAICLTSPGDAQNQRQKQVVVYETGQIAVENVVSGKTCDTI